MYSSFEVTAVRAIAGWWLSALHAVQKGGLWSMMATGLVCMLSACNIPTQSAVPANKRAVKTPSYRYAEQVFAVVEKKWKLYRAQSPNDRACGRLRVHYSVDPEGKVEHIQVRNNKETDPVLIQFTVKAIQDAKLPPMPAEVVEELKKEDEKWLDIGIALNLSDQTKDGGGGAGGRMLTGDELTMLVAVRLDKLAQTTQTDKSQTASETRAAAPTQSQVEAQRTPRARYTRLVTTTLERKWSPDQLKRKGVLGGILLVEFYVNEQGKVEDLLVLDDRDSNRALTEFTLQAIRDAEIPPMPADVIPLLPKKDRGRLKIEYHVLIY